MPPQSPSPHPAPTRTPLPAGWEHAELHQRVLEALRAAPSFFQSAIRIAGLQATDLHTLNTLLGATIEDKIVETLNRMRSVWDPNDRYASYTFQRQSQTFPDVLFRLRDQSGTPVLGIELKGWYLLALEGEPSFRFQTTPAVCAPQDLIAIFPWHLSEVISGEPVLLDPFIEPAKYVAEYRNWFWENRRERAAPNPVILATTTQPYPSKNDPIADQATSDSGGNFGRIARVELMDTFVKLVEQRKLAGIPASSWRIFISAFVEGKKRTNIEAALAQVRRHLPSSLDQQSVDLLVDKLRQMADIIT